MHTTDTTPHSGSDNMNGDVASDADLADDVVVDAAMRDAMWRGNGGWEIAATPVLTGALGWVVDGWAGTLPIFTVLFAVIGLVGAIANQYYRYVDRMNTVTEERTAAREAKFGAGDGPRFAPIDVVETPSYVLESDLASETVPAEDVRR